MMLTDGLDDLSHLVQLLWADVRAICEPKVDQAESSLDVLVRHSVSSLFTSHGQLKGASDAWPPNLGRGGVGCFPRCYLGPLMLEVEEQAHSGDNEEGSCSSIEGLQSEMCARRVVVSAVSLLMRSRLGQVYSRRLQPCPWPSPSVPTQMAHLEEKKRIGGGLERKARAGPAEQCEVAGKGCRKTSLQRVGSAARRLRLLRPGV